MSEYVITDGGRSEAGISESRDCTVRALVGVTGLPYKDCHEILAKCGRQNKRGVVFKRVAHKVARLANVEFKQVSRSGSLRKFLRSHSTGSYYVTIRGHAMAVRDGVILDMTKPKLGSIIKSAWAVRPRVERPKVERLTLAKVNAAIREFGLRMVQDDYRHGPRFYYIEVDNLMHLPYERDMVIEEERINDLTLEQWRAKAMLAAATYAVYLEDRYCSGWAKN